MNSYKRIEAVFEHRQTDKVPIHHVSISSKVASAIMGREVFVGGGIQRYREAKALWEGEEAHKKFLEKSERDAFELAEAFDMDFVRPSYWRETTKPSKKIDEYTFYYGNENGYCVMRADLDTELYQVIESYPEKEITFETLEKQMESAEKNISSYTPKGEDFAILKRAQEYFKGKKAIAGHGVGVSIPYNPPIWLEASVLRKDLVGRYLDVHVEYAIKHIEIQAKLGIKFLRGGGDFASNRGPFYSPKIFNELMLPRLKRISEACHKSGCYHMFASDGNLWPVANDLFGASGVDAFFEIDRLAGMDLRRLREEFPHLTLIGNVSSKTLHIGTKEDVIAETIDCIETAKKFGSIAVGCSNIIVPETPVENVVAMMETLRKNR